MRELDKNLPFIMRQLVFMSESNENYVEIDYPEGFNCMNSNLMSNTATITKDGFYITNILDVQFLSKIRIYTKNPDAAYKTCSITIFKNSL